MTTVVLLHGISRFARSMNPLARRLANEGYMVANWDYPSRTHDLGTIADQLAPRLTALGGPVHFVTHSMGGLVARALLARQRPAEPGRVVMLAPPNGGSEVADRLLRTAAYRWWFGPAGAQLATRRDAATTALFGPIDYELGVIAGTRSFYPLASGLLPGPNDGRVSVARTTVEGMTDHLILPVSHPLIMRDPAVLDQVVAFLKDGRFKRQDRPAHPPPPPAGDVPAS